MLACLTAEKKPDAMGVKEGLRRSLCVHLALPGCSLLLVEFFGLSPLESLLRLQFLSSALVLLPVLFVGHCHHCFDVDATVQQLLFLFYNMFDEFIADAVSAVLAHGGNWGAHQLAVFFIALLKQ